jgi:diguanylate cyclase (GGDEF)-like protein
MSYGSIAMGTGLAGLFVREFLEDWALGERERQLALICSYLLIANAVFIVTAGPFLPIVARNVYHAAFLPPLALFLYVMVSSAIRGSFAIWFLIGGWFLTLVSALDRILRGMDLYLLPAEFDFSLYLCFAVYVLVTASGSAFRVFAVRRERDLARSKEQELVRMATTDGLTGLSNRRAFDEREPLGERGLILLIDIDHFKRVNDTFGHHAGDDILRSLGNILKSTEGPPWNARAYRTGGEEFAVVMDAVTCDQADSFAEQFRARAEAHLAAKVPGIGWPVTVSIGLAAFADGQFKDALHAADAALYLAKAEGRNKVRRAETPGEAFYERARHNGSPARAARA